MARNYLKIVYALFAAFLFASCSYPAASYYNLSALFAAEKGDYEKALSLLGKAEILSGEKGKKFIDYNTAVIYREMGEPFAAFALLETIDSSGIRELEYRKNYELGSLSFTGKDYERAAGFFKKAVLIDDSDIKLIKNLELSILMLKESNQERKPESSEEAVSAVSVSEKKEEGESEKILEIMFSGEELYWEVNSTEAKGSGKDW